MINEPSRLSDPIGHFKWANMVANAQAYVVKLSYDSAMKEQLIKIRKERDVQLRKIRSEAIQKFGKDASWIIDGEMKKARAMLNDRIKFYKQEVRKQRDEHMAKQRAKTMKSLGY